MDIYADKGKLLFNCKDITPFANSIRQVLPFSGVSKSMFFLCEYENVHFLTKMCFYNKTSPELFIDDLLPPNDTEIKILQLMRKRIIEAGVSPCVLEIIHSTVCSVDTLAPSKDVCDKLISGSRKHANDINFLNSKLCDYNNLVEHGLGHNKIAFVVMERCDITFDTFLQIGINTEFYFLMFKSLIFMIIHVLYAFERVFAGFRHHDLHTDNVMLKYDAAFTYKHETPQFLSFKVGNKTFNIPYFGIVPKIIDFGASSMPSENIHSALTQNKKTMYKRSGSDILHLMSFIHSKMSTVDWDPTGKIDAMMSKLDPNRFYASYRPLDIKKNWDKVPSYEQMLNSDIFAKFKHEVPHSAIYKEYTPV